MWTHSRRTLCHVKSICYHHHHSFSVVELTEHFGMQQNKTAVILANTIIVITIAQLAVLVSSSRVCTDPARVLDFFNLSHGISLPPFKIKKFDLK